MTLTMRPWPELLRWGAAAWQQALNAIRGAGAAQCEGTGVSTGQLITASGNPEVDQAARNAGNLGDRPLVVLTAGQYWKPDDPSAAQAIARFHQIWVHQLQADLTHLSTRGKQILVENSDHGIPNQAPEAVVRAVRDVVVEVRTRQPE